MAEAMSELQIIEAALQQASRRRRWARALRGLWRGLLVGAVLLLVAIGVWHLLPVPSWTVTAKPPTCDPAPEQRLEVQRLVLLRLHGVVSGSHQNRAKPPAALSRSAEQLRINAQSAVMRNCSALRLRLAPDGGFAQLFLTACISQQALASGEQCY